jgi:hypothetical protein
MNAILAAYLSHRHITLDGFYRYLYSAPLCLASDALRWRVIHGRNLFRHWSILFIIQEPVPASGRMVNDAFMLVV